MSKIQILVIEGGWVMVGEPVMDRESVTLNKAYVIRKWGTDKGLGQIAMNGPTKETILDKLGTAFIERRQVRFTIPCDDTSWKL